MSCIDHSWSRRKGSTFERRVVIQPYGHGGDLRRILLTGATGYLGSRLLERLVSIPASYQVTVLKRSFSNTWRIDALLPRVRVFDLDRARIDDVFAADHYDSIVHCATDYGRGAVRRGEIIEANLLLPLRLLEAGLAHGVRRFVNTDTILDKGVSDYTLSKRQFREWLEGASGSISRVNMVLEHFYGPGDDESKFVTQIVRDLLRRAPSIALTHGAQKRDFIFVDDVVDAFMLVLEGNDEGFSQYEVGCGRSVSVKDFVTAAKSLSGNTTTRLDFGAIAYRANEPMDVRVDISRLRALGWSARVDLHEGLRRSIEFEEARAA
jgi:CDP-paratose synthetase